MSTAEQLTKEVQFQEVWNSAETAAEAAERLGMKNAQAASDAASYYRRRKNLKLKRMPSRRAAGWRRCDQPAPANEFERLLEKLRNPNVSLTEDEEERLSAHIRSRAMELRLSRRSA